MSEKVSVNKKFGNYNMNTTKEKHKRTNRKIEIKTISLIDKTKIKASDIKKIADKFKQKNLNSNI